MMQTSEKDQRHRYRARYMLLEQHGAALSSTRDRTGTIRASNSLAIGFEVEDI